MEKAHHILCGEKREIICRKSGGAVVLCFARWNSDLKVGGSMPSPCHRAVSLDKKLYPTLSLSIQVYK